MAIVARLAAGWAPKIGPTFGVAAADGVAAIVVGEGEAILDCGVAAGMAAGPGVAGIAVAAATSPQLPTGSPPPSARSSMLPARTQPSPATGPGT